MDVMISAIAGVVTGAIGSLLAPWATWGVEKKRTRQERRSELIQQARKMLNAPPSNIEFRRSELYSRLRPHLSQQAIDAVEGELDDEGNETIVIVIGEGRGGCINPYAHLVLDEISSLEAKWDLI